MIEAEDKERWQMHVGSEDLVVSGATLINSVPEAKVGAGLGKDREAHFAPPLEVPLNSTHEPLPSPSRSYDAKASALESLQVLRVDSVSRSGELAILLSDVIKSIANAVPQLNPVPVGNQGVDMSPDDDP